MRRVFLALLMGLAVGAPAAAQVQIVPLRMEPAAWDRVALRVAGGAAPAIVAVRIELPDALAVLGVEPVPGWVAVTTPSSSEGPTTVEWAGGRLASGEFREFAFLGRLAADIRQRDLRVNVALVRENGDSTRWRAAGDHPPLRIAISGTTSVSPWAAVALAGGAFGVAVLALAFAIRRGPPGAPARGSDPPATSAAAP